jgi:hypothetical protein
MKKYFTILTLLFLMNCANKSINQNQLQGIEGQIVWLEGNLRPSKDKKVNKGKPVQRTLYIYPVINEKNMIKQGKLYQIPANLEPIKKITTDENGKFKVDLEVGNYSIFTEEPNQLLFANSFDGEMNIAVVKVEKNKVLEYNIKINYKATY